MTATKTNRSIKYSITWIFTLVSTITISVLLSGYIYFNIIALEDQSVNQHKSTTELLGKIAQNFLITNDHQGLQEHLQLTKYVNTIEYLHIYRVSPETQEVKFFTSYNKESNPAIPDKIAFIDRLSNVQLSHGHIELIRPIYANSSIIGYVYLNSSLPHISFIQQQSLISILIAVILTGFISYLLGLHLQNKITLPIKIITRTIQQIGQQKDYTLRVPETHYRELEILSRNVNLMLAKINKHIATLSDAEQQILKLNQDLEDKVNQRTMALKDSNQELVSTLEKLHQFQGQLVENEKMASLGDMVAGVAHEVNTPVGLGVTASTLLADRLSEIKQAFDNKTLKSSQLSKFLNDGEENVSIIYRNLKRAADLISSFKQVAVDQSSQDSRVFDVKELINEVTLTLAPQLKKTSHQINVQCEPMLMVESKPGPINQILINLIMNSIIHGFEHKTDGIIDINVMMLSNQLHINYKDNGKGVDANIKTKIFDPFITTKRGAGGSGLGLHLVYNLVTQALGGSIYFDSEVDQGVSFDIEFPVHKISNMGSQIPFTE